MNEHRALSAVEQCNLQDELTGAARIQEVLENQLAAMQLEVLALREALESAQMTFDHITTTSSIDCSGPSEDMEKALSNTEESAKRIKAGIEAYALDLADEKLDLWTRDCGCGVIIRDMAEERRAIAKGEK